MRRNHGLSIEQIGIRQSVRTFLSCEILVKDPRSVYSELEQVLARDVAGKEEFQANSRDWFVVWAAVRSLQLSKCCVVTGVA